MADPTIQTFCCHHGNGSEIAFMVMSAFNSDLYNSICLISSALGMLGSIYQILPRKYFGDTQHRWLSFSAMRGRRIIVWLAIADLLASIGVFVRASIWMNFKNIMPSTEDDSSVLFCALSSAWTQYFYTASWIWTFFYALDIRLILSERRPSFVFYHITAWLLPAVLTSAGLSLLYLPDADCHSSKPQSEAILRVLPNYIATYFPIALVMIANPLLYRATVKDTERVIMFRFSQVTSTERDIVDTIRKKFIVINVAFYICWVPNLANGVMLWTLWFHLPVRFVIITWYIMALMNPLQALLNCLVYRRWSNSTEKLLVPWHHSSTESLKKKPSNLEVEDDLVLSLDSSTSESYPLLRYSSAHSGINKYCST